MNTPPPTEPHALSVPREVDLTQPSDAKTAQRAITPMSPAELAIRVNFMDGVRAGANLHQAAAMAGCGVRTIYGWLATEPGFLQRYHNARWEAEKNSLEHVRQLASESVRAAIYLAERRREQSQRRTSSRVDQPLEEILARIDVSLHAMLEGFGIAVRSVDDEELRERLLSELESQVEPVNALFGELWQRFEMTT